MDKTSIMKIKNILILPLLSLLMTSCSLGGFNTDNKTDDNNNQQTDNNNDNESGDNGNTNTEPVTPPQTETNYFPIDRVREYYASKGITGVELPVINIKKETLILDIEEKQSYPSCLEILIRGQYDETYIKEMKKLGYVQVPNSSYKDKNNQVRIEAAYSSFNSHTVLRYWLDCDYDNPYPLEDTGRKIIDYEDDFVPSVALPYDTNLNDKEVIQNDITYKFDTYSGNHHPTRNNDKITLYNRNKLTISSTTYTIDKIVFTIAESDLEVTSTLTPSKGEVTLEGNTLTYLGPTQSVSFVASGGFTFTNIQLTYPKEISVPPDTEGISTIKELKEAYKDYQYTLDDNGYYRTNDKVTLQVRYIARFDSKSNVDKARGKTLVIDETGAIILSSPIYYTNNEAVLYKCNFTWIQVEGYVAFDHDEIEVNVTSLKVNSNLRVKYQKENLFDKEITTQEELLNDVLDLKTNESGYRSGNLVKFKGITFYQQTSYNHCIYLDKNGHIIPVYSPNTSPIGNYLDLYAMEMVIDNRPYLVPIYMDEYEDYTTDDLAVFNDDDIITVCDLNSIYSIKYSNDDTYRLSMYHVYKADVYFSKYCAQSYSFNTTYYSYLDSTRTFYSTGQSLVDIIERKALISMNGTNDNNYIDSSASVEVVESKKITYHFVLTALDEYNNNSFWRVSGVGNLNKKS